MALKEEELFHTQPNLYYTFNKHHFRIYVTFLRLTGYNLGRVWQNRLTKGLSLKIFFFNRFFMTSFYFDTKWINLIKQFVQLAWFSFFFFIVQSYSMFNDFQKKFKLQFASTISNWHYLWMKNPSNQNFKPGHVLLIMLFFMVISTKFWAYLQNYAHL